MYIGKQSVGSLNEHRAQRSGARSQWMRKWLDKKYESGMNWANLVQGLIKS